MPNTEEVHASLSACVTAFVMDAQITQPSILVAVSGGVDSMVLLHTSLEVCKQQLGWHVQAVHVNHHLRPGAGADARFVEDTCRAWGIPVQICDVNLEDIPAADRQGVEADARHLRYKAIADEARMVGADCVLLAHHADDQLETVIWRLARGASLTGLSGMRPHATRHGLHWLRPFLALSKSDLAAYASTRGIPYVEDETNADDAYTRNYIRHHIVPLLKGLQPNLTNIVYDTTRMLQDEDDYMESEATSAFHKYVERVNHGYRVDIASVLTLHRSLQRRLIKILLYCFASNHWTSSDIESILAMIHRPKASSELHLAGHVRAIREYNELVLTDTSPEQSTSYSVRWRPADALEVEVGTERCWRFQAKPSFQTKSVRMTSKYDLVLPRGVTELLIRTAEPGDRIRLLGLNGSKKVHDIFVDAKVPRSLRGSWPLLEVDGNIVWIPGLARSRDLLVDNPQDGVLWIHAEHAHSSSTLS